MPDIEIEHEDFKEACETAKMAGFVWGFIFGVFFIPATIAFFEFIDKIFG